ncbi:TonB-dependent receptor [candidate division KSB1 bacterium]|nr:TonB-dependent receptor [candidate division KSB1 bacterium]
MKKFIIILALAISVDQSVASVVIHGYVRDKQTNAPLALTNISLQGTSLGTASDSSGYFRIENVPPGQYTLVASQIGYHRDFKHTPFLNGDIQYQLDFELQARVLLFAPIQVDADRYSDLYNRSVAAYGSTVIPRRQYHETPGLFDDPARAVQILQAAIPVSDYNSYYAIRGGSPDQNLVVLDGAPIPNPYRFRLAMGGGMSILNANTTESIRLHVNGFSAAFGNMLASVLEVTTRPGSSDRFHANMNVNILDAGLALEGPLFDKHGSWLISARRTYYDLIAPKLMDSHSVFPNSRDVNVRLHYRYSDTSSLDVHWLCSHENANINEEPMQSIWIEEFAHINWVRFTWQRQLDISTQRRSIVAVYNDSWGFESKWKDPNPKYNFEGIYDRFESKNTSISIHDIFTHDISQNLLIQHGLSFETINPDVQYNSVARAYAFLRQETPYPINFDEQELYSAVFGDVFYKVRSWWEIMSGLRFDYSHMIRQAHLSPRIKTQFTVTPVTTVSASLGITYQYPNVSTLHIRDRAIPFPDDPANLDAEKATHASISISHHLNEYTLLSLEVYNKKLSRLIVADYGITDVATNAGYGYARGIEIFVNRTVAPETRWNGFASYSYGTARYKHEQWYPFNFDRRHGLSLFGQVKVSNNFYCSAMWRVASGLPYTPVTGFIWQESDNRDTFIRGEKNIYRMPGYNRLDIRFRYARSLKHIHLSWYIDLLNILNHPNVYDRLYTFAPDHERGVDARNLYAQTIYMLPFLPTIGFQLEF